MKFSKTFSAKTISTLLIGMAGILFIAITFLLIQLLTLKNMFPSSSRRHDIRELTIGVLKDTCGIRDSQKSPPQISDYEECLRTLELNANNQINDGTLALLQIPNLNDIYSKGRPSVQNLLKQVSPNIAKSIYTDLEPFVIGIEIPDEYYSKRVHDNDHYKLVHGYVRNAIICVERKCEFASTLTDQGVMAVPLFRAAGDTGKSKIHKVWIFGRHIEWAHTMSLQNGIFISKDSDLWQSKRFYPLNMNAGMLAFTLSLSSIFIVLFITALTWRNYADHLYLLLLGINFSGLAIFDRIMAPQAVIDQPMLMVSGHIVIWSLVAASAISLSLTTLRISTQKTFLTLLLVSIVLISYGYYCVLASGSTLDRGQHQFDDLFHLLMSVMPASIGIIGAIICWTKHKEALSRFGNTSASITFLKRFWQQIFFTIAIFAFNWPSTENYFINRPIRRVESISTTISIFAYLCLFLNMIRPSIIRLKRAMDLRDTISEAGVLKLLMGRSEYEKWKSQSRCGYVIEADIRGSTSAIPELKQGLHTIMKVLKQMIINDLLKADHIITIMKPMGDAWIFIIQPTGDKLDKESFNALIEHFSKALPGYERILKNCAKALLPASSDAMIQGIGLNLRIFSVTEYYLRQTMSQKLLQIVEDLGLQEGIALDLQREDDSDIDFIGEEAHLLLKYLPKPSVENISVGCSKDLMSGSWSKSMHDTCTLEEIIKGSKVKIPASITSVKRWQEIVTFQFKAPDHN